MPPKPRPVRKSSTAAAPATTTTANVENNNTAKEAMPPPPDPPVRLAILEPEVNALSECLKNAAVTTGQIFRFYSDAKRLAIHHHAPDPPRSLTSSLAYEVGKYDQLCDALESQLLRAISVLQRDLTREEVRLKDAEKLAPPKDPSLSPTATRMSLPPSLMDIEMTQSGPTFDGDPSTDGNAGAEQPAAAVPRTQARRQSKISLSTLHRSFPLKLDLSSSALRLGIDEAGMGMGMSGLASPVTLAPKSARPMANEITPELMATLAASTGPNQPVDVDLMMGDPRVESSSKVPSHHDVGSSAEKPIELDLELDVNITDLDLFGDPTNDRIEDTGVDELFTPGDGAPLPLSERAPSISEGNNMGMAILDALSGVGANDTADLFASLHQNGNTILKPLEDQNVANLTLAGQDTSVPSPSSILASLGSNTASNNHHANTNDAPQEGGAISDGTGAFDYASFDMSEMPSFSPGFLNSGGEEVDLMEQILTLGDEGQAAGEGDNSNTTSDRN